MYNEFYTSTPKYYRYQISVTGGIPITKDENNTYDVKLHYKSTTSDGISRSSQIESVAFPFNKRALIHENIPPIENEPYSVNTSDQMAKITHQLILVDWPGEMIKNIAIDYPNFTKSLLDDSNFGNVLKKGDFIKDFVVPIQNEPQLETADKVYKTFIEKVQWDGYHHYRTEMSGKTLFKQGKGDSGDINLNYIAALNEMGIASFPVIMSTRGNGTPHPVYPDFSDFNYVFAVSVIGEKLYFSDATSGLGFGILPIRCLNGDGWIVSENGADWIKTKKDFSGRHALLSNISFADNKMNMKSSEVRSGYFAFADNEILKDNEADFIKSKYQPDNVILDSMLIVEKKINSIKSQFVSHWDFEDENLKYVYPFELRPFKDNPFKKEKRSTTIDFPFIQEYKLLTHIDIGADEVFEVPQNIHAAMGENAIVFKYTSNFNNSLGKLSINIDFKINQTEFLQEEYPELREAFDNIIKKISEPVIIKKKL
ncbi:MAG: hypothetical protein IPK35_11905 [Saprospiraceae bacterium]|nr:hypothetical protein [Saprospiraceae bacterium]